MDSKDTEYVSRDNKNPDYLPMDMVKAIAGNLILHQTIKKLYYFYFFYATLFTKYKIDGNNSVVQKLSDFLTPNFTI